MLGKEALMKFTSWTATTIIGLAGLVATSGCATTKATSPQVAGLTAQQLIHVADPQPANSWLPKLPLTGAAKPKPAGSTSLLNDAPSSPPLAKGDKKKNEKADFMAIARLNERHGQRDLAKQIYHRELEKNPKNGEAHHRLAIIAAQEQEWDKANQH